jgi:uncharacterized protein
MHRLALGVVLLSACGAAHAPAASTPAVPDEWSAWRARRLESLAGPDGWLTLVALCWLPEAGAPLTGGSAPDAGCVVSGAPLQLGAAARTEGGVRFEVAAEIAASIDGAPFAGGVLVSDAAPTPTVLEVGSLRIHVIDRGGRLGLRIKDRESAARLALTEVPVFPYDGALRRRARFEAAAAGTTLPIVNVLGMQSEEPVAGTIVFSLDGTEHRLIAMPAGTEPDAGLFVMLTDATSGESTYGGGRYLDVDAPVDGAVTIDLNFLETPPCGFTELATCPLPPPENELSASIEGGERWLGDH